MADQVIEPQDGTPAAGTTQDPNAGTSIDKFKSADDRDKAYLELERSSRDQARELSEMKRQLDDFRATVDTRPQGNGETFTDVYKSQDELKKFWERFASKPEEVFAEREAKIVAGLEQRFAVREAVKDSIAEFKAKNPDLAPYEEIVSVFVQRQPAHLNPRERLERAAPEARKMIAQIAQKAPQGGAVIDPATYVESPSGTRDSSPAAVTPRKQSYEDELAEYLKEQSSRQAKQQTPPRISK